MVGLDPKAARILKDLFREYTKRGHTIMMSTHTLEVAEIGLRSRRDHPGRPHSRGGNDGRALSERRRGREGSRGAVPAAHGRERRARAGRGSGCLRAAARPRRTSAEVTGPRRTTGRQAVISVVEGATDPTQRGKPPNPSYNHLLRPKMLTAVSRAVRTGERSHGWRWTVRRGNRAPVLELRAVRAHARAHAYSATRRRSARCSRARCSAWCSSASS